MIIHPTYVSQFGVKLSWHIDPVSDALSQKNIDERFVGLGYTYQ